MVTKQRLDKMFARPEGPTTRKYKDLVPVMMELYHLGMTVLELQEVFPVSKKWIRAQFGDDFEYRGKGVRSVADRPTSDQVIAILKREKLSLAKLSKMKRTPGKVPKGKGKTGTRKKKKTKKRSR